MSVSCGGVLYKKLGNKFYVLLREPTNHYEGFVWTFAKGLIEKNETKTECALREVMEETGYECNIGNYINVYSYKNNLSYMFLMTEISKKDYDKKETANLRWVNFNDAEKLIKKSTNIEGRNRDLLILKDAAYGLLNGKR